MQMSTCYIEQYGYLYPCNFHSCSCEDFMTNHCIAVRLFLREFRWVKRHASISASSSSLGEIAGVDDYYTLYDLAADRLE